MSIPGGLDSGGEIPTAERLIDGYLDQILEPNEYVILEQWLLENPDHARRFAEAVLLHDRLRSEVPALAAIQQASGIVPISRPLSSVGRGRHRPLASLASIAVVALAAIIVFWNFNGVTPASAAVAELNRIILVSAETADRTYQITVEAEVFTQRAGNGPPPDRRGPPPDHRGPPGDHGRRPPDRPGPEHHGPEHHGPGFEFRRLPHHPDHRPPSEQGRPPRDHGRGPDDHGRPPPPEHGRPPADRWRPPKPPMNGALLHVRNGRQFVLVRMARDGRQFVTGSDGQSSWAVRPDGPVRVSSDLSRFSRDVPGHEHSIPLINIQDGLEGLLIAYDVELQTVESQDSLAGSDDDASQLLIAVKKSQTFRGPRRVEITYAVRSGLIRQIRFVDMPYAQDRRLTLLMSLVEDRNFEANFFHHESHHTPERAIEFED